MFLKLLHFVFLATLLQLGVSQNGDKRSTTLNNSSLSLVLGDQCVTRSEVEAVIRAEVENAVQAQTESIAQTVRNEIQSIRTEMQAQTQSIAQTVRNEIQSIRTEMQAQTQSIAQTVQSEVQLISTEMQAQTQSIAQTVQNEIQSIRTEIQSLTRHIAEIQNNTEQVIAASPWCTCNGTTITQSPTEAETTQSTESLTAGQTTEQSTSTTEEPLYTCNGTPGWRQVAFINMTDTSYDCPPGLKLTSYSKRTCGRAHTNEFDCSSTTFSVGGSEYSQVCGRIRGYQVGVTGAFNGYLQHSQSINGFYVDGMSLTHGPAGRRQHIWSFAGGLTEVDDSRYPRYMCPCDTSDAGTVSPPFVGNDYFCESGLNSGWPGDSGWGMPFLDDPLWDGQNCTSTSTCCQLNNPPWFTKNLSNPTSDDIELRICSYTEATYGNSALDIIELYLK